MGTDWLYWTGGGLIALSGAVLAAWAIFADRARGRRRCPKCWYPMEGIAPTGTGGSQAFVCPECGRAIKGERGLLRTRRRPWAVAVSAVPLLLGYFVAKVPAVRAGDWTEVVPGAVLAFVAPVDQSPWQIAVPRLQRAGTLFAPRPAGVPRSARLDLCVAAWERIESGRMTGWPARVLVERYFTANGGGIEEAVRAPARWLASEPIPVVLDSRRRRQGWIEIRPLSSELKWRVDADGGMYAMAAGTPVRVTVEVRVGSRAAYARTLNLPVQLVPDVGGLVEPVDSSEAGRLVKEALDVRVVRVWDTIEVLARERDGKPPWTGLDFGLAYRVEIYWGDRLAGTSRGAVPAAVAPWTRWRQLDVQWSDGGVDAIRTSPEGARVVVKADPVQLLRRFREWPMDGSRPRVWTVSYEMPLQFRTPDGEHPAERPVSRDSWPDRLRGFKRRGPGRLTNRRPWGRIDGGGRLRWR